MQPTACGKADVIKGPQRDAGVCEKLLVLSGKLHGVPDARRA